MKNSEKPAPDFLRLRGARLRVPSGLPRRCRLAGDLGRGCFAAPIQLPPEDECPIIRATFADHAFLFGLVGDALLGNCGGEALVSAGTALGLLPGEYTLESVGHLAPLLLVVTLPSDAADRIFERGLLSQCFLEMAHRGVTGMKAPEPVGGIHPLPRAAERVAHLLPSLPFCGRLGDLIGSMGGLRDGGDLYSYLARGPCRHRAGKPRGQFPERFSLFTQDSGVPSGPPLSREESDRLEEKMRSEAERFREQMRHAAEQFVERIRRRRTSMRLEVQYWIPEGMKTVVIEPSAD